MFVILARNWFNTSYISCTCVYTTVHYYNFFIYTFNGYHPRNRPQIYLSFNIDEKKKYYKIEVR